MDSDGGRIFQRQGEAQHAAMSPGARGRERGAGRPARALLVTAMALFAQGLRVMLDAAQVFQVAGECHDAAAALEAVEALEPDLVVLDADMPGTDTFDLAARIRRLRPGVGIVLLTEAAALASSRRAAGSSVDTCVPKTAGFAELQGALHRVASHRRDAGEASATPTSAQSDLSQEFGEPRGELTGSERRLMRLLTQGLSDRTTAAMLGMSSVRLEAQRNELMGKLGFASVTALIRGRPGVKAPGR